MNEIQRSYYAIIPANVRYDTELTPNAKLLYGEITALCNEKGYCWAGDKYFSNLYRVNRGTIQRWIKQLEDKEYITRTVIYREGTREIETRYIHLCDKGIRKNETTPIRKNETVNITSSNTTFNNTYKDILSYLNEKTDKNFKHTTKKTQDLIKARTKEGFTKEDFYKVIDNKVTEWKNDPKMERYLRPDTLFGTKFEGYLNQKAVKKTGADTKDDQYDLEKHGIGFSM